jgi:hypothetical protein
MQDALAERDVDQHRVLIAQVVPFLRGIALDKMRTLSVAWPRRSVTSREARRT